MNIIYLHTHDMGRVNSIYGRAMPSPYLRAFAEHSLTFRQAFSAAPTCSPSRAALLTGLSAHESGVLGLIHRGFRLADPDRHLARYLSAQGYETCLCGVQHEVPFGEESSLYEQVHVFDQIHPVYESACDQAHAEKAAAYLKVPKQRPFFLSCGIFAPHRAFATPGKGSDDFVAPLGNLPDLPEVRADIAGYQASLEQADRAFGTIFKAIFAAGLYENSLIIVTTDHGVPFPGAKCTLKDAGIGVTLMMRAPGQSVIGQCSDAMVSHLDIFPTICDYAALELPPGLEGYSLRPVLEGAATAVREELFAEVNYHTSYEPLRCIRTSGYKYIRLFDSDLRVRWPNIDPSPSKDILAQRGGLPPHAGTELYDLICDPHEQNNLAGREKYRAVEEDLRMRLHQWMEHTNDPLLQGPIPRPPGARISDF